MGIQPIDLQTLYSQLDKIGKTQVQQQVAAQSLREQEIQNNKAAAEQRLKTVQGPESGDELSGKIHDREDGSPTDAGAGNRSPHRENTQEPDDTEKEVIRDPNLGKHIDISG